MHPQFFEASITIILATALASYTFAYGQRGRARNLFIALLGSIATWSGGVALSRAVGDPGAAQLAARLSFLGIYALPPVWYALSLHLTRRGDYLLPRSHFVLLAVPSALACALMVTNPWHHLYMRKPELLIDHGPLEWAGPLFWAWVAWSYLLVFGGSARYVGWSWQLVNHDARWRGALVCVASIMPLTGNVFHLMGISPANHDFTPMLLGAATVLLFVGDWRFRLLDTLPVARRDVIEHLRDGVVVADSEGFILDMNPAAERMVEARLADLIGKPIVHAIASQAVDRFDFDEQAITRTVVEMCSSARGFETVIENFEGRQYEISGAGVTDAIGEVSGLYIIIRDVTERSRIDEMQRETRRAQTIASLAAGITHEVNNPLAYVRANVGHVIAELAAHPEKRNDTAFELQDVLAEALEGIDRIGTIVERVRKFAHTRGSVRESIPIEPLFEEAMRIRAAASGPSIGIVLDVAPGLSPALGFRDGLLETLLNLLDNALHALRETGGVIRLKARSHKHAIRIEVEDDGPGVPEEIRDRIFEPFFTTASSETGTGLGLTVSAKLVADFGGTLRHEPVDDGGARFVIELPQGPQ